VFWLMIAEIFPLKARSSRSLEEIESELQTA
jgi:hypothetical protein